MLITKFTENNVFFTFHLTFVDVRCIAKYQYRDFFPYNILSFEDFVNTSLQHQNVS